jgi:hypothetical protein
MQQKPGKPCDILTTAIPVKIAKQEAFGALYLNFIILADVHG